MLISSFSRTTSALSLERSRETATTSSSSAESLTKLLNADKALQISIEDLVFFM
jgi:hypothetical protein